MAAITTSGFSSWMPWPASMVRRSPRVERAVISQCIVQRGAADHHALRICSKAAIGMVAKLENVSETA